MAGLILSLLPDVSGLWILGSVLTGLAFGLVNGALIASCACRPSS